MKNVLLTGMLCLFMLQLSANTIFVKQNATGTGDSWTNATGDLSAALFIAKPGDEVWVAAGTYLPTNDKNREKSFLIPSGVRVYGGFSGNEASTSQRNIAANRTVLSGNIGSPTIYTDNSYSVVFMENADENTLLEGFTIADGNADGTGPTADMDRCGGGMYISGTDKNQSKPVIQHCVFQNNYARDGGAAYLNGRGGVCSPSFRKCDFFSNKADLDGGAVFNDGRHHGKANPAFNDCNFASNQGNYGGAICNYGGKGESSPQLMNCIFRENEAYLRGGAIFNMDVEGIAQPVLNDCQFVENEAVTGKGMYTFSKPDKDESGVTTAFKMN